MSIHTFGATAFSSNFGLVYTSKQTQDQLAEHAYFTPPRVDRRCLQP